MRIVNPPAAAWVSRERFRLRRRMHVNESMRLEAPAPTPGADPEILRQLEIATQSLASENNQLHEAIARQRSEFDNYRRRMQKEKEHIRESATETILAKLLPVLDNFERALESISHGADAGALRQGIEMVADQMMRSLAQDGLTKIEALDAPFNPSEHEALAVEERSDVPENQVVQVMLPGYKLKEKVIRPAMVKVAKAPSATEATP